MFNLDDTPRPKAGFRKADKRPFEHYPTEQQKLMKKELNEHFGMNLLSLLMTAERNDFKPKSKNDNRQKMARDAGDHLLMKFCLSSEMSLSSYVIALCMKPSPPLPKPEYKKEFRQKPKFRLF